MGDVNEKTTEEQILLIVGWYNGITEDYLGLNELIHKRKTLATLRVFYAVEMGKASKEWKAEKAGFDALKSEKKIDFEKAHKVTKAEWYATVNMERQLRNVNDKEADYWSKYWIDNALKSVLEAMNQQIADLRGEKKQLENFS